MCTGTEQWGLGGTRALNQALESLLGGFGELFLPLHGVRRRALGQGNYSSSLVILVMYSVMGALI